MLSSLGERWQMWESRDLTLVIFLSVVSYIYALLIGQLAHLITGILGLDYFFIIGHAIFISFGLLIYEGRRWRYFLQSVIVALLFIPTFAAGTPFDVLARMPIIFASLLVDLIFNTIHGIFKKGNKLVWWAILGTISALILLPFFTAVNMYIFYPSELMTLYVNVVTLLLPVIIIESIAGGCLGYKIYERITKLQ